MHRRSTIVAAMRRWPVVASLPALALASACSSADPIPSGPAPFLPEPPTSRSPAASAPATIRQDPAPSLLGRLDPAVLAGAVSVEAIAEHLAALQAVADRSGGTRATGTPGHVASVRHVTNSLVAAGYTPALEPFTVDGVSGTNVLAERRGSVGERVLVVGAHLDSAADGPGINDNGSGVAVLLVLAEVLAALPPPEHSVRFAFWDAEEGGPIGSEAHVAALPEAERARIVAYLNLDMVGSPNPVRFVYDEAGAASGSAAVTEAFAAAFEAASVAWDPVDLDGASDHGPFVDAGIPTGGVFSGGIEVVTDDQAARHGATVGVPSDPCSHQACDTLDNVDPDVAAGMARIVATVLAQLATP
jgi:aminopeptidase S